MSTTQNCSFDLFLGIYKEIKLILNILNFTCSEVLMSGSLLFLRTGVKLGVAFQLEEIELSKLN